MRAKPAVRFARQTEGHDVGKPLVLQARLAPRELAREVIPCGGEGLAAGDALRAAPDLRDVEDAVHDREAHQKHSRDQKQARAHAVARGRSRRSRGAARETTERTPRRNPRGRCASERGPRRAPRSRKRIPCTMPMPTTDPAVLARRRRPRGASAASPGQQQGDRGPARRALRLVLEVRVPLEPRLQARLDLGDRVEPARLVVLPDRVGVGLLAAAEEEGPEEILVVARRAARPGPEGASRAFFRRPRSRSSSRRPDAPGPPRPPEAPIFSSHSAPASSGESDSRFASSQASSIASGGRQRREPAERGLPGAEPEIEHDDRRGEEPDRDPAHRRARDGAARVGLSGARVLQRQLHDGGLSRPEAPKGKARRTPAPASRPDRAPGPA